ncbi:hypothetical protein GLIP_3643 [Aliiglaciecola lipolytica E3]|uniref:Uncharacterized protein n=1 Tax=Aliiglaciecola lipolytica E3 TaxID=1127673 RepID=K6X6K9_9ALTE|nr:hypothetical protein GLIP_3643 [Aliiglaciecola lipolytica E3]
MINLESFVITFLHSELSVLLRTSSQMVANNMIEMSGFKT